MPTLQSLAGHPLVRRFADHALGVYARRRAAALDRMDAARAQERLLLRLVRQAQNTRFGREHDFAGVRGLADYRRRVPLRDYEAFWSGYWQARFPFTAGETWPDEAPYFGLSSGTTSGATKYLPLTRPLLRGQTRGALTSLAWFLQAYPGTPLLTGRLFFLGGSTDLVDLGAAAGRPGRVLGGDLSGVVAREAPGWMRPYTFPPVEAALMKDWEQKMTLLARQAAALPVTMLSGVPSWMLLLFERLRQVTGKAHVAEVWPGLRLLLHGGTKFDPYRALFREQVGGEQVRFSEVYPASEAYIAAQDHRTGLLRLIPDAGVFYEFVPVEEVDSPAPTRHALGEVELGVNYAVVLTTCAGLWAYVLGDTVVFERRRPPLLRFSGRTKYFLSAFGEHLISEEVEKAVAAAAAATGSAVVDFHVGPVFPEELARPGRHRYLVEFASAPPDVRRFAAEVDAVLCRLNEDYQAHRQGDLTMLPPEVIVVRRGGFAGWMKAHGKLGGQHKVPRMDNSGEVTREMAGFFAAQR
jgi:hypothetical protein